MKQIIIILICITTFTCCDNDHDDQVNCEFSDPLEELSWLKEYKESLIDCNTQISIFQAIYKKQIVFYSAITDPLANSIFRVVLWNCEGEAIKIFEYDKTEEFGKLVTNRTILYRCKDDPKGL